MQQAVFPNTFLIGVQKAGTTTLDDWLSQHPEIYCYSSLKDVHLFARFKSISEIEERLAKERPVYNNQPVVFQSAVNYIFYPFLLESIARYAPDAKLMVILRNPVDRAISSYNYFKKMLRETRSMHEALLYEPKGEFEFSHDNSDFTYIEHGFYYKQISNCFQHFNKEQLLVLDYDDLANNPDMLLENVFSYLQVDKKFRPDLSSKNVTGSTKSKFVQQRMVSRNKYRKWVVDNLLDSWLPLHKRKMIKKRIFEFNTSKDKGPVTEVAQSRETITEIKMKLKDYFVEDAKKLDDLLGTNYGKKWFEDLDKKTG